MMPDPTILGVWQEKGWHTCSRALNLISSIRLSSSIMARSLRDGTILKLHDYCAQCGCWVLSMQIPSQSRSVYSIWSHVTGSYRSFMEKVKEGQIKITATKLPTFLYDESMFDPAKKSQGCLRGYYLKRVRFFLFLSVKYYLTTWAGFPSHLYRTIQCPQPECLPGY